MPPRTIEDLVREANNYDFSPSVSFRSWVHVANAILRQADIYNMDGSLENAYILYERFAHLVINDLYNHPDVNGKTNKAQFSKLVKDVRVCLEKMGELNPILKERYEAYRRSQQKLQHKIHQRQQLQRQEQHQEQEEWESKEDQLLANDYLSDNQFLKALSDLKSSRNDVPPSGSNSFDSARSDPSKSWYPYPNNAVQSPMMPTSDLPSSGEPVPPPVPPKNDFYQSAPLPQKTSSSIEHKIRSKTESGSPLRTVFLPEDLREEFLGIARPNTLKKLETCGILCGKLNRNAFFITHLVIPPQESTSDTCTTTDEIVLFDFIDTNELFVLGWIHTHPTQSCFLSSIDLHTQSSYQIMLPEAVAIVCAPQYEPSWGIFRLTDPPGLDVIKQCRLSSTFHPHPEEDIYRQAFPGHINVKSQLAFEIRDLRK